MVPKATPTTDITGMLNDIQICHQGENKMTTEMVSIVLI
jgi:hypothetical protein